MQRISINYSIIAGRALDNYLFNLCALEKLDITYESSYNLQDNRLLKREIPLNPDQKLQMKLRQGELLLLQIISGLEVSLSQGYLLINVIEKFLTKEITPDEIQAIEVECLKKPWTELWSGVKGFFEKISDTAACTYIEEMQGHASKYINAEMLFCTEEEL